MTTQDETAIELIEKKLVIFGGRDFHDYATAEKWFLQLCDEAPENVGLSIVSGLAKGADSLGVHIAQNHGVQLYTFPADWDAHGKSAGHRRNAEMAKFADYGLGFFDGSSRGTKGMINEMQRRGKLLQIVPY